MESKQKTLSMVGFIPGQKTKKQEYRKINIHGRESKIRDSLSNAIKKLKEKNE